MVSLRISQDIFWKLYQRDLVLKRSVEQLFCNSCQRYVKQNKTEQILFIELNIIFLQRFLADRYVAGTCPDPACKFVDARGDQCDKCGKLINAIELVDPKCQICKTSPEVKSSDHLFLDLKKVSSKEKMKFNEIFFSNSYQTMFDLRLKNPVKQVIGRVQPPVLLKLGLTKVLNHVVSHVI